MGKGERKRDRYHWFILYMAVTGPGQSQKPGTRLRMWWQSSNYLGHLLLLTNISIELDDKPRRKDSNQHSSDTSTV